MSTYAKELLVRDRSRAQIRFMAALCENAFNCKAMVLPAHWAADMIAIKEREPKSLIVCSLVPLKDFCLLSERRGFLDLLIKHLAMNEAGDTLKVIIVNADDGRLSWAKLSDVRQDGTIDYKSWVRTGDKGKSVGTSCSSNKERHCEK